MHIYTDTLTITSSADLILSTPLTTQILRKKNHLIWSLLKQIVSSLNLTVVWHKVDAHASDSWNSYVDILSKTRPSHQVSVPYQEDISSTSYFTMNDILIDDDIIRLMKD